MPDVLIRGLDAGVLRQLKTSAMTHGRSLQAEIHDVLTKAGARSLAATRRLSAVWLRRLEGARHADSTRLIRSDRERR